MTVTQEVRGEDGKYVLTSEYEGMTLSTGYADDSLFERTSYYAMIWDEASAAVKSVYYWSGYWGQSREAGVGATVDASEEVRAKAFASEYQRVIAGEIDRAARERVREAQSWEYRQRQVVKGSTVEVVKGRKVPKDTTGVVIWVGDGQYGRRVGLKDASGAVHWTAAGNVEVREDVGEAWDYISPEDVERDRRAAEQEAAKVAARNTGYQGERAAQAA